MGKLHFEAKVSTKFLFGLNDNRRRALTSHIPKDLIMTPFVTSFSSQNAFYYLE